MNEFLNELRGLAINAKGALDDIIIRIDEYQSGNVPWEICEALASIDISDGCDFSDDTNVNVIFEAITKAKELINNETQPKEKITMTISLNEAIEHCTD